MKSGSRRAHSNEWGFMQTKYRGGPPSTIQPQILSATASSEAAETGRPSINSRSSGVFIGRRYRLW